jgi:hypothetical protein
MPVTELLAVRNDEDRTVALAVRDALPLIGAAVEAITESLRRGGRLIYLGAGTSGRIGPLDAVECPPTFGPPAVSARPTATRVRPSAAPTRFAAESRTARSPHPPQGRVRPGLLTDSQSVVETRAFGSAQGPEKRGNGPTEAIPPVTVVEFTDFGAGTIELLVSCEPRVRR